MNSKDIVLIVHDIRSCHNVGSLLRTAEGLGITKVYITGYTPYPTKPNDTRLPHIHQKLTKQIHKTALGAEISQPWEQSDTVQPVIDKLITEGYVLYALEQSDGSIALPELITSTSKLALILGSEVEGVSDELLKQVDHTLEIPMFGKKESFNVVQAAAMALYQLTFK